MKKTALAVIACLSLLPATAGECSMSHAQEDALRQMERNSRSFGIQDSADFQRVKDHLEYDANQSKASIEQKKRQMEQNYARMSASVVQSMSSSASKPAARTDVAASVRSPVKEDDKQPARSDKGLIPSQDEMTSIHREGSHGGRAVTDDFSIRQDEDYSLPAEEADFVEEQSSASRTFSEKNVMKLVGISAALFALMAGLFCMSKKKKD